MVPMADAAWTATHSQMDESIGAAQDPELMLRRLSSIWLGLPSCSVIVLRHLQKTGGTSILKLFEDGDADALFADFTDLNPAVLDMAERIVQERLIAKYPEESTIRCVAAGTCARFVTPTFSRPMPRSLAAEVAKRQCTAVVAALAD